MRHVVDTNVAIVANGRGDPDDGGRPPAVACRLAAIAFLERLLREGRIVLDLAGEIQSEYHRHLSPRGQPGVGDRFYREVLNSAPRRVERVLLPKDADGNFVDFPEDPALATFDLSDRKFAALSRREKAPVANATDSDWLDHRQALHANGISVEFVCGCDRGRWFI